MALIIDELLKNTSENLSINEDFQAYLKTLTTIALSAFNNKSTYYKDFLEYLQNENSSNKLGHYLIRNSDITIDSIFDYINNNADLHGDFDSIIELMKEDLLNPSSASNHEFWNESLSDLIKFYIEHYEIDDSTYAYVHNIDVSYEWDLEDMTVEPIDYSWREIDIRNADAGAAFDFIPTNIYDLQGQYGWVIPWYNINKETFYKVEKSNIYLSALNKELKLQFTKNKLGGKDWIRLIMPQYNRRVEILDLNRNFWVIGQVIAAISEHLFSDENPIYELLKKIIGEILELWENTIFLWALYAAWLTSKKNNLLIQQALVMPENELYTCRTFDIQTEYGYNNISFILNRFGYLLDMYPNNDLVILPIIRAGNYKQNLYHSEYYPYILYRFAGDSFFNYIKLNNSKGNTLCFTPYNFNSHLSGATEFANYFMHENEDGTYRYCSKNALFNNKDDEERLYTGAIRIIPSLNFSKTIIDNKPAITGKIVFDIYDIIRTVTTGVKIRMAQATIDNLQMVKTSKIRVYNSPINVSVTVYNGSYTGFHDTVTTSQSPIYLGECPSTQIFSFT